MTLSVKPYPFLASFPVQSIVFSPPPRPPPPPHMQKLYQYRVREGGGEEGAGSPIVVPF